MRYTGSIIAKLMLAAALAAGRAPATALAETGDGNHAQEMEASSTHEHSWVERTEQYWVSNLVEVVDREAWVEPVYETQYREICSGCGADITGDPWGHIESQVLAGNYACGGFYETATQVQTGTNHHDAETHEEDRGHFETRSVSVCSVCGETMQEAAANEKLRIAGDTRYGTSAAISAAGFESADTVIVASGENFPDALAASSAAGALDAPVLLTGKDALSAETAAEIERLGAKTAIIVGGTAAVSQAVQDEIDTLIGKRGGKTDRIAGDNRRETAYKVVERLRDDYGVVWGDTCIVVSDDAWADVLAASSYAYAKHAPIILVGSQDQAWAAESAVKYASTSYAGYTESNYYMHKYNFTHAIIVGGYERVTKDYEKDLTKLTSAHMESPLYALDVERIAGETRYETAEKMARRCIEEGLTFDGACVASGENFPDALAGGALAGSRNSVLLLTGRSDESAKGALDLLSANKGSITTASILGGPAAVSDDFAEKMAATLGML